MSEFRFEVPPNDGRSTDARSKHHIEAAAALMERPGEWAMIRTAQTSQAARDAAHQIREGRLNAYLPVGAFDAMSRTVNGEYRVYARYVGPAETADPLAKARAAAAEFFKQDTGVEHPKWRLIVTDSESLTGLAPVCAADRSDALHMIDDYPGGPKRDEEGVYDCCPWPQIETYSGPVAAYLVALLNADAEQAQGGAS